MDAPGSAPFLQNRVGRVLHELEELAVGVAARQHVVFGLVMLYGIAWLGGVGAQPRLVFVAQEPGQRMGLLLCAEWRPHRQVHPCSFLDAAGGLYAPETKSLTEAAG